MMHQLYWLCVLAKEIVSLLSLQLMHSYLNELTLHAGIPLTQPSFSSWPHSDITSILGHSVTCTFLALPFFAAEMFWDRISNLFKSIHPLVHVGFPASQNTCDSIKTYIIIVH